MFKNGLIKNFVNFFINIGLLQFRKLSFKYLFFIYDIQLFL